MMNIRENGFTIELHASSARRKIFFRIPLEICNPTPEPAGMKEEFHKIP
jgi:hypothetical protein